MPGLTRDFAAGNYCFIPAVFQYSSGAAADSGFEIERVRFDLLIPLAEGFAQAAKHIQAAGRPLTAFCACELRSPSAFTEATSSPSIGTTSKRSLSGVFSTAPVIRSRAAMSAPRSVRLRSRRFTRSLSRAR